MIEDEGEGAMDGKGDSNNLGIILAKGRQ